LERSWGDLDDRTLETTDEDRIAAPDVERARAVLLEDLTEELADLE